MANGKEAAALLTGVAGGSLLTLLVKAREARAAPPEGVDPALWDMFTTLLEAITIQTASIDALVRTLGGAPTVAAGEDPFENTARFITGQVVIPAFGAGVQLPPHPIPKNKQLVIKALPGNVGWVMVGVTQADSQRAIVAYPLVPNEGVGLFVQNSDKVWVALVPAPFGALNDGIAFIVEAS